MTNDELLDLLMEIEATVAVEDKPHHCETAANALEAGEPGRAALLIAAGEHWQMSGDHEQARRCFDAAIVDGGEGATHPVGNLLSLALDLGDEDEASAHLRHLRELARADRLTPVTCLHVGDTLEEHGRLREAHRWFTMPLSWVDDEDDLDYYCLISRRRVRRELGLRTDRLDEIADEELAARQD